MTFNGKMATGECDQTTEYVDVHSSLNIIKS